MVALHDKSLADEEREVLARKASIQLAGAFLSIAARVVLSLGLGFIPIWVFDIVDIVRMDETLRYMGRVDVIVVSTVAITVGLVLWHRLRNSY